MTKHLSKIYIILFAQHQSFIEKTLIYSYNYINNTKVIQTKNIQLYF